jgi:hypothetical protein
MQEWKLLLVSGDVSDSDDTSEHDGKPHTYTKPLKYKTKFSASQAHSQIKSSLGLLKSGKKGTPFRALRLPDSINWLEPELMKGKTFEDTGLRANAAGTCGLSTLTCLETSHAYARKIHTLCKSLPPMANASQEELSALKAWRDDIRREVAYWLDHVKTRSDVGAKLSAALYSKETDVICQQMAKFPELAPARTILLNSCPTQTPGSPRPWRPLTSTGLTLLSPPTTVVEATSPGKRVLWRQHIRITQVNWLSTKSPRPTSLPPRSRETPKTVRITSTRSEAAAQPAIE